MGHGLSPLQRYIVTKAATVERLYYHDILQEYYGWQSHRRQGPPWNAPSPRGPRLRAAARGAQAPRQGCTAPRRSLSRDLNAARAGGGAAPGGACDPSGAPGAATRPGG